MMPPPGPDALTTEPIYARLWLESHQPELEAVAAAAIRSARNLSRILGPAIQRAAEAMSRALASLAPPPLDPDQVLAAVRADQELADARERWRAER